MPHDFGINAGFVEELYAQYLDNPSAVEPSWRAHFDERSGKTSSPRPEVLRRYDRGLDAGSATRDATNDELIRALDAAFDELPPQSATSPDQRAILAQAAIQARVYQLVNAYRVHGHLFANVDPLGLPPPAPPELDLANFGLSDDDLDRPFPAVDLAGPAVQTLREIIDRLEETYCRSIGVEFTHIEQPEHRSWLQHQMESTRNRLALDRDQQLRILGKLSDAEIFEQFIHKSYELGTKRFSLEGAESLIPLLDLCVEHAANLGVEVIVLGMAHRGRLNVMANILDKSPREIFAAFEDSDAGRYLGSGDVKYHLGYSTDKKLPGNRQIHLTLTVNPSHLEFVCPVVEGRVRAKQERRGDAAGKMVMPLLIHGDAAFMGQGVVAETLNLSNLEGYSTGGTLHVIVNNQIGFTTNPNESRSTRYATDIVRMLKAPVFHVNGEDPEAVAQVATLATEVRQRSGKDVVIDMFCYRKYGHNEGDEPRYTQPRMYAAIDKKPTIRQVYMRRLNEMGQITPSAADRIVSDRREALAAALDEVKREGFAPVTYSMEGVWTPYYGGPDAFTPEPVTAVPAERLVELSAAALAWPASFKPHPKVVPILKARHERLVSGQPFDWATAEMLAYATLVAEGTPVRLSGQDARRGTFSHRHAVLFDHDTGAPYSPTAALANAPGRFDVHNSPLSEAGVLGFDYGYSLDYPDALVIWEAQFGDFLNSAQVIVDQFITSCEDKWHRLSGIVLFLPHGYEGQGPEHSSARAERFLQNSADDNIQVCNLTTPAQLFHALRRQVLRLWRKPLIVLTPKSLLRVSAKATGPRPVSTLHDLTFGRFQRVIGDTRVTDPSDVTKILLCSGKIYYDLAAMRDARGINDTAIVRLEMLYPINDELKDALAPYRDGTKLVWVQEEPRNYGAWYYVNANLPRILSERFPLTCVSRAPGSSPATGSRASHLLEQKRLLDEAFS